MATGVIIANVSEALGHSFFSATVDYKSNPPRLWVFGSVKTIHALSNHLNLPLTDDIDGHALSNHLNLLLTDDIDGHALSNHLNLSSPTMGFA